VSVFFDEEEDIDLEVECPFCFHDFLNLHGACKACGTILGHGKSMREQFRLDAVGYGVDPEYDKKLDVDKAINRLDEQEQRLVRLVMRGEETLEEFAAMTNTNRMNLWRIWVRARAKLQNMLKIYDRPRGKTISKTLQPA
jgi:predicted DNA-binding protein (UPF0251 family)